MSQVINFPTPKIFLRTCDKPECPRCLPRSEWTIDTYNNADDKDKQWMKVKGFNKHDYKTA